MNEPLQINRWKFDPTEHAAERYRERVQHIVNHINAGDFCRQARLATPKEARACRKSCPIASLENEEKNAIYLWHEKTEVAIVVSPTIHQSHVHCAVITFLDMAGQT